MATATPRSRGKPTGRPAGPVKRRINIVIEPHVLEKVRKLAERERRSLSAQIQILLEEALSRKG